MRTNAWYFDNGSQMVDMIENVKNTFPCFVTVETLELDWILVTVRSRAEDTASIERIFSRYA